MTHDPKLVDDGAVRILLADEYGHDGPYDDECVAWARRALGIGEELKHYGDCTKVPITCILCVREEYQRKMRAALDAIVEYQQQGSVSFGESGALPASYPPSAGDASETAKQFIKGYANQLGPEPRRIADLKRRGEGA